MSKELKDLYDYDEINALVNIIIKTITGLTKLHELYNPDLIIASDNITTILTACTELKKGKPIQYVLGETTFYDMTIKLSEATLIPRPETEELVDLIIKENTGFRGEIIDIGTGSGCIAIALANNIPGSKIRGVDISEKALAIARENAILNNASAITFSTLDVFNPDYDLISQADIMVSNPPYVMESEKRKMHANVLEYEPHTALFVSDNDPLVYYRAILNIGNKMLKENGKLYFEINEAMGKQMLKLMASYDYSDIQLIKDINNKVRFIKAKKND